MTSNWVKAQWNLERLQDEHINPDQGKLWSMIHLNPQRVPLKIRHRLFLS